LSSVPRDSDGSVDESKNDGDSAKDEPRCACGYGRGHYMVSAEGKYDAKGWFLLMLGATPDPVRLVYSCRRCGGSLGESTDPEDLKRN
jgi:hypothetical protein